MLGGLGKYEIGNFSHTPEEKKKDPNIAKKIEAANEALKRKNAEQARGSLQRHLEETLEEEEEKMEKVA